MSESNRNGSQNTPCTAATTATKRVLIRRSNTLQQRQEWAQMRLLPPHQPSSTDPDLDMMVHGPPTPATPNVQQVSSVCSQLASADSAGVPSAVAGLSLTASSQQLNSAHITADQGFKDRVGSCKQWLLRHCVNCATRFRDLKNLKKGGKNGANEQKTSSSLEDPEMKQYWGPLIGHGENGHAAKPLFSTFRVEGHVTTSCLWHGCRAVTIGSFLIIMGMTMSVLGELIISTAKNTDVHKIKHLPRFINMKLGFFQRHF